MPGLGFGHARQQAGDHRVERNAARGVGLRVEHDLGMDHAIGCRAIEISRGKVVEVALGAQYFRTLIIDIEKVLQPREAVGGANLIDARERDRDLIALGQCEHQLRLEAALDMKMELSLGQASDEAVEIGHAP